MIEKITRSELHAALAKSSALKLDLGGGREHSPLNFAQEGLQPPVLLLRRLCQCIVECKARKGLFIRSSVNYVMSTYAIVYKVSSNNNNPIVQYKVNTISTLSCGFIRIQLDNF